MPKKKKYFSKSKGELKNKFALKSKESVLTQGEISQILCCVGWICLLPLLLTFLRCPQQESLKEATGTHCLLAYHDLSFFTLTRGTWHKSGQLRDTCGCACEVSTGSQAPPWPHCPWLTCVPSRSPKVAPGRMCFIVIHCNYAHSKWTMSNRKM